MTKKIFADGTIGLKNILDIEEINWSDADGKNKESTYFGKAIDRLAAYEDTGLLPQEVECLTKEIDRLNQWVNDLQSGMYVNCVYCGHRYGPAKDTPVSMADVLKQHIEKCPKHPMSALKRENEELKAEIDRLTERAEKAEARAEAAIRDMTWLSGYVVGGEKCNICKHNPNDMGCVLDGSQFNDDGECHFEWREEGEAEE